VPTKASAQEAAAADLATLASEGQREEGHSAEVLAFSSAAAAAATAKDKGRKGGRRPPKRKPLNPAAE
jgi:hypothetical protein